jgi:hypothetical protein
MGAFFWRAKVGILNRNGKGCIINKRLRLYLKNAELGQCVAEILER